MIIILYLIQLNIIMTKMNDKLKIILKIVGIVCLVVVTIFIIVLIVIFILLYDDIKITLIIPNINNITDIFKKISIDVNTIAEHVDNNTL